jgi:hypothetical protein
MLFTHIHAIIQEELWSAVRRHWPSLSLDILKLFSRAVFTDNSRQHIYQL